MRCHLLLLGIAVFLTACQSVPTPPAQASYQTIPLNQDSYRISLTAPLRWSRGDAEEMALFKTAQFTLSQGFDHFKVLFDPSNQVSQQANSPRQALVYPAFAYPSYGYPYRGGYGRGWSAWDDPFWSAPYVVNIEPIEVAYTIKLFKKQYAPADSFDAQGIFDSLSPKYRQ